MSYASICYARLFKNRKNFGNTKKTYTNLYLWRMEGMIARPEGAYGVP